MYTKDIYAFNCIKFYITEFRKYNNLDNYN